MTHPNMIKKLNIVKYPLVIAINRLIAVNLMGIAPIPYLIAANQIRLWIALTVRCMGSRDPVMRGGQS